MVFERITILFFNSRDKVNINTVMPCDGHGLTLDLLLNAELNKQTDAWIQSRVFLKECEHLLVKATVENWSIQTQQSCLILLKYESTDGNLVK